MTEEEARAEQAERDQLISQINSLSNAIQRASIENANLNAELETLIRNIEILTDNAREMDSEVNESMEYIRGRVAEADVSTADLFSLIDELTSTYFTFKNLSTASKNVSQYTDEYFTKFGDFNELRRISLGYVVGLDAHVCSSEGMRKKVEAVYLKNTEYWLAYAIMSVMLWASDEEEASKRAMAKALNMDYFSASLFYLLINLRFTRVDAAKKWYLSYLDRVDMEDLGKEWQYLLQAYLAGVFGVDKEFQSLVFRCFTDMLKQMEAMHPDYGTKVSDRTMNFSKTYVHVTKNEFETLRRHCTDYEEMKALLSDAEKNELLAVHFREVMESESNFEPNVFQRVENILYDLVNSYDKEEFKIVKKKRYNEMVVRAKGNVSLAQQWYEREFPSEAKKDTLEDLLFEWAFEEDMSQVDIGVKRFSVTYLKKWIAKGFAAYGEAYRKKEKDRYAISIDGWTKDCSENSMEEAERELVTYYNKNRLSDTLGDKYVKIFLLMAIASLGTLVITAFAFNKVMLVIGILLGVASGFLLWRRIADLQAILQAKIEKGCATLKKALEEMKAWRALYKSEDVKNADLVSVFENIEI